MTAGRDTVSGAPKTAPAQQSKLRVFAAGAAALVLLMVGRWPFRARHYYEWDSAQYALGVLDFDVYRHRPHPPGYPIWVFLLKGLHVVIDDLNLAQVVAAFATCALAAWLFFRFARELHGRASALVTTTAVFCAPPVVVASVTANTYPVDILGSTLLGWIAARMWNGEKRLAPLATVGLAIFAGTRQSGAVLMAPLVGVALLRACRFDWKTWAISALSGGAAFAAWYVPVVRMHDGVAHYQAFLSKNVRVYFHEMSFFYGASPARHLFMLSNIASWTAFMVAPLAVTTVAVWAVGRSRATVPGKPMTERGASEAALRLDPLFFALWLAPNIVYTTGFHCPKPGYLLLSLPALGLAAGSVVRRGLLRIAAHRSLVTERLACIVTVLVGSMSTAAASVRYEGAVENRASLSSVRQSDDGTEAVQRAVGNLGPDETLVVVLGISAIGPNLRSLQLDVDAEVWALVNDVVHRYSRRLVEGATNSERHEVPTRIRHIVWIHSAHLALPRSIAAAFPGTKAYADTPTINIFTSDIGDAGIDAHVLYNEWSVHLFREGRLDAPNVQLGSGWGETWNLADPIAATTGTSELFVRLPRPMPVTCSLGFAYSPVPSQRAWLSFEGKELAELHPKEGWHEPIPLEASFQGHAGENLVVLHHAIWNGSPVRFLPPGWFALAAHYRSIGCTVDGVRYDVAR